MAKYIFILFYLFSWLGLKAQESSGSKDSLLQIQIAADLQKESGSPISLQPRSAASANPDLSVIGDFRGGYHSFGRKNVDAQLHEAEFSFQSVVDPYARADFFLSAGQNDQGEFAADIEEGYLTSLSLPAHLQLKAGRFRQDLGRVNTVHPHALPFIDMPTAYVNFFGEEGLKGDGLSLSWLLPNRIFFQELTLEATDVTPGNPSILRSRENNFLYLAHLKNFWDLSSNSTLEFGLTGMSGENFLNHFTQMIAVDLTYKWKPVKFNTYHSVTFQNELYYFNTTIFPGNMIHPIGLYSLLNVQVAKRWFLAGRYDFSNGPYTLKLEEHAGALTIGWNATEFQKIELEGKYTTSTIGLPENDFNKTFEQVYLRWIFVIGSHGAHQY